MLNSGEMGEFPLEAKSGNSKLRPGTWNPSEQRNWTMWMELVVLVSSDVCELIETDDPMKQRNSPKLRSQVLPTSASRGLPVDLAVFDPVLFIMAAVALKVILLEKWLHNHHKVKLFSSNLHLWIIPDGESFMKRRGQRARRTRTQRVQQSRVRAGQGIAGLIVGGCWWWWFSMTLMILDTHVVLALTLFRWFPPGVHDFQLCFAPRMLGALEWPLVVILWSVPASRTLLTSANSPKGERVGVPSLLLAGNPETFKNQTKYYQILIFWTWTCLLDHPELQITNHQLSWFAFHFTQVYWENHSIATFVTLWLTQESHDELPNFKPGAETVNFVWYHIAW